MEAGSRRDAIQDGGRGGGKLIRGCIASIQPQMEIEKG